MIVNKTIKCLVLGTLFKHICTSVIKWRVLIRHFSFWGLVALKSYSQIALISSWFLKSMNFFGCDLAIQNAMHYYLHSYRKIKLCIKASYAIFIREFWLSNANDCLRLTSNIRYELKFWEIRNWRCAVMQ